MACALRPCLVHAEPALPTDAPAILAVIEEEKQAYLALDAARISAAWLQSAASAKRYVFEGRELRFDGFAAIENHDLENLAKERALPPLQRSQFAFTDHRVSQHGDSAWVTCHAKWSGYSAGAPLSAKQMRLYVLHQIEGRWKIALMAIIELGPDAPSSGPDSAPAHPEEGH
jgi:ketosteroid isomerase-like protein